MAESFAPKLNGEVRFNQPIETPSMFAGLADVASGIASAFVETKIARDKAADAGPGGPTYAQAREQQSLSQYTNQLTDLQQKRESGAISENQFKISVGNLNKSFASQGFDVSGSAFDNVRVSITGLPSDTITMTSTQMMINDLQATPEGQGRLRLAEARLVDMKKDVTDENIAAVIELEEMQKAELDMINVQTEADFAKAEPDLRGTVQNMAANFETSLRLVEQAGIRTDDPEFLQNSYLSYTAQRQEIVAKIPLTLPGREEKIKALFGTTDAFFERLGVTENGQFTQRSRRELDMVREGQLALEMVQADPEKAAMLIESGYADPNFTITPELYTHLSTILAQDGVDIKTLAPNTPAWIAESGVIITNDMVSVASQLQAIGPQMLRSASEMQAAFKSQVGEEVWNNWSSRTAEEAWSSTGHYGAMLGGYDAATIRGGQVDTKAVTNNLVGLATSFAVIDLENEPVSFGGIRKSVSAQLPAYVDALEQADPQNGKAARSVLFTSLGMAARQYEAGVTSVEGNLGITFDPKKRAYTLDTTKISPNDERAMWAAGIVNRFYGGDILKAIDDDFKSVPPGDIRFPGATGTARSGGRVPPLSSILNIDKDEVMRLLDMRNSVVYLDGLAGQIEPKEFKDARELLGATPNEVTSNQVLGAQALEAVATAPNSGDITTTTLPAGSGYRIPEEVAQDQEFVSAAGKLAADLSIPVDDVFRVIEFETAGSWSPAIKNPGSTATGLIQFLESTAKGLGTTTADLAGMTRAQQMEYVGKYLEPYKGRIKNFGDLYMAVHYPKAIGQSETYVMYSQGSAEYAANKNLDTNGDGTVTRGETIASVIARTGGGRGVMTTPATAQTAEFASQAAADISSVAPPGGFATAPASTAAPSTEAPAPAPEAATADMPVDFSSAATGTMPQEGSQVQAPSVDAEVKSLIDNLSTKTKRQLKAAGIEPSSLKFFETDSDAEAAIESGELQEGDAYILSNGQVNVIEAGEGDTVVKGGAGKDTLTNGVEWDRASGKPFVASEGDTLQAANPTMRDKSFSSVQAFLTGLGVEKGTAREYASRLVGDPTTKEIGVADLTIVGSAFMGQEGIKTIQRGIETGDSSVVAQGAVEAGLAALSAIPVAGLIGKGLSKVLKAAPKNSLKTVVRVDDVFRGEGVYKTSLDTATKPYAVRLTGESQIEDMVRSGLVRPKEGGYQGRNIVYYGEMDDVTPTSIFTKPKPNDKQKNYTIVADSAKIADSTAPATLDDLLHVWTIKDGELVDVLPELILLNNMVK